MNRFEPVVQLVKPVNQRLCRFNCQSIPNNYGNTLLYNLAQLNLQSTICTHPLEMPPPAEKPPEGRSTRFMTRSTLFESADNYKAYEH